MLELDEIAFETFESDQTRARARPRNVRSLGCLLWACSLLYPRLFERSQNGPERANPPNPEVKVT